jgi:hypothetical protein
MIEVLEIFSEASKLGREYFRAGYPLPLMSTAEPDWLSAEDKKTVERFYLDRAAEISRSLTFTQTHVTRKVTKFLESKKPCKRCLTRKRYASDGTCVECRRRK